MNENIGWQLAARFWVIKFKDEFLIPISFHLQLSRTLKLLKIKKINLHL